jgi:hypothetical protein
MTSSRSAKTMLAYLAIGLSLIMGLILLTDGAAQAEPKFRGHPHGQYAHGPSNHKAGHRQARHYHKQRPSQGGYIRLGAPPLAGFTAILGGHNLSLGYSSSGSKAYIGIGPNHFWKKDRRHSKTDTNRHGQDIRRRR